MTGRPDEYVPFTVVFGLPAEVGLRVAASALGLSMATAYRWVGRGTFPCPLRRVGRAYVVRMPDLLRELRIQDVRVHYDDIEAGARFAAGITDD
ncbi:helix-turn-helix transcriptional regulator [Kitasatospora sp. NPDC101801]|uniref:helix-turn-helix transcriptional regulator n=1 Tax=Kitasatospora sp. NPDC101801 TaxID=3364103 RepID=UPI00382B6D29